MKKTAFFLLLFMQFSVLAFAGGQKDKGLSSEALALDRQANDFFYEGNYETLKEVNQGIVDIEKKVLQLSDDTERTYIMAVLYLKRADFVYGSESDKKKRDKKIKPFFKEVEDMLSLLIEQKVSIARVESLYSHVLSRQISDGINFMTHITKSHQHNERALDLNKNDPMGLIGLSLSYLFTPEMFGGNPRKTLELCRKAIELSSYKYHKIQGYIWSAYAYDKLGSSGKALEMIHMALEIAPNDVWALELKTLLERGESFLFSNSVNTR